MTPIKQLEDYAMRNYESGGHWVVECFGEVDYQRYLDEADGRVNRAKRLLKEYWLFTVEQCQEVQDY